MVTTNNQFGVSKTGLLVRLSSSTRALMQADELLGEYLDPDNRCDLLNPSTAPGPSLAVAQALLG